MASGEWGGRNVADGVRDGDRWAPTDKPHTGSGLCYYHTVRAMGTGFAGTPIVINGTSIDPWLQASCKSPLKSFKNPSGTDNEGGEGLHAGRLL